MKNEIPETKLRNFYEMLKLFSNETQYKILTDFNRKSNYTKLVDIYETSKKHFDNKYNYKGSFLGNKPDKRKKLKTNTKGEIKNTNDLVFHFQKNKIISFQKQNDYLNFEYIEREISPIRTPKTKFESGKSGKSSGIGGVDFIGWNTEKKLPILGEIKIKNDENPFYALIQLLTYLSEFSTPRQIDRINKAKLFKYEIPRAPKFFLYIVLSNYNWNSKLSKMIFNSTKELSENIQNKVNEIEEIIFIEINSLKKNVIRI